jgi:hypothetical protein
MTKFVTKNIQLWHILALPSADNSALVYVDVPAQGPRQPNFSFTAPLNSCIISGAKVFKIKMLALCIHECTRAYRHYIFIQIEADLKSSFVICN